MNQGDTQAGDEEVAREAPLPVAGGTATGQVRAEAHATEDASGRSRRGVGRRVTLARQRGGGYSIWMMTRHIQGFCNEWEDVTNFQLPDGFEQQIRINVETVGEVREIRPEYSGELRDRPEVAQEAPPELAGRNADDDLIGMYRELPEHNREIIAGQIRANHLEFYGAPLVSRSHPNRLLNPRTLEEMEVDLPDRVGNWRDDARTQLHREMERIGDVILMIDRLDTM